MKLLRARKFAIPYSVFMLLVTAAPHALATVDVSLSLQSRYSDNDLSGLGIANDVITLSSYAFAADGRQTIQQFIDASDAKIRGTLNSFLESRPEIERSTSDLVVLDIEAPVHPKSIGSYEYDGNLQASIVGAFANRIRIARDVFPNAKLSLFGVGVPNATGNVANATWQQQMRGLKRAADLGMLDQLDYISPALYPRWGETDKYANTVVRYTRSGIEYTQTLTRSDGSSVALAPFLTTQVYNGRSAHHGQSIDPKTLQLQVDVLNSYPAVQRIVYWSGSDSPQLGALLSQAQSAAPAILTFDFIGASASAAPLTATSVLDPNLMLAAGLDLGAGVSPGIISDANEFNIRNWTQTNSLGTAIVNSDYIGFSIAPDGGFEMDLTKINFGLHRHGAASSKQYAIFSSLDGFTLGDELATFEILTAGSANDTTMSVALTDTAVTGITDFRIYGFEGIALGGQNDFTAVSIEGVVVPEPDSLVLIGAGALMLLRHRRRAA